MDRAEWLIRMRSIAEAVYDRIAPAYWDTFGLYENAAHQEYLRKFLARVEREGSASQLGMVLSAACGAGRYDGLLLEAGYNVLGIDQSAGMLARAREHFPVERFPSLRYEKMSLQEIALEPAFREAFVGAICIDALEHVFPEDWPGIMRGFRYALRPGGVLYITVEPGDAEEVEGAYRRSLELGLPVVYGEVADEVYKSYQRVQEVGHQISGAQSDPAVYHFHPAQERARAWIAQSGLVIEEEGPGSGYHHFIACKPKT